MAIDLSQTYNAMDKELGKEKRSSQKIHAKEIVGVWKCGAFQQVLGEVRMVSRFLFAFRLLATLMACGLIDGVME
jgi:hypothetical protein